MEEAQEPFSLVLAMTSYRRRVKAICDAYGVSELWGANMSFEEIEWFERRIRTGRL